MKAQPTRRAVLALGSNVGDRLAMLQGAVYLLSERMHVLACSSVYETDPVGGPEQDDFLNAVVLVESDLTPEALLTLAHRVERAHARTREVRWGPRTLDVDVIAVDGEQRSAPRLTLPHPMAAQRAFVLVPWLDVDADATLPDGPVAALVERAGADGVRRRDDLTLRVPAELP